MNHLNDNELSLPVIQEELEVHRETVDTGRPLRLRKQVEEVSAFVREPLNVEEVQIERVPIGQVVEELPAVRQEGDVTVVPVIKERLVTRKEFVLVEEIRLTRQRKVAHVETEVPLRRENVLVERFDPGSGNWLAEPGSQPPLANPVPKGVNEMETVIAAFKDRAQAERARDQLVQRGFDRDEIHIEYEDSATAGSAARQSDQGSGGGISGFFASLFGSDDDERHASTWNGAVQQGNSVVVVDVQNEQQAQDATSCLHSLGAIDIDEHARQLRTSSNTGRAPMTDRPAATGQQLGADKPVGKEGVMDVVQEELQIGKRKLDQGGVRVVQRVSSKPVREVVRLREERAVVDRRPADRPANANDMNAFKEGTLEVRESSEEAVVSKNARVVEEVRIGKEVREREEVVNEDLRRKDVDVERIQGEARERAVASDTRKPLMPEDSRDSRETNAGSRSTLTGSRKKTNGSGPN